MSDCITFLYPVSLFLMLVKTFQQVSIQCLPCVRHFFFLAARGTAVTTQHKVPASQNSHFKGISSGCLLKNVPNKLAKLAI